MFSRLIILGRITKSPHIILYESIDNLLNSLYKTSKDRENRDALKSIISSAMSERAAFVNGDFYDPISFILFMSKITEKMELIRLEKRIDTLLDIIKNIEEQEDHNNPLV